MEIVSMREKTSKLQTENTTENINETKSSFFEKIKKIINFYLYLLNKEREGLNKVRTKEEILQSIASKHNKLIWLAIHQQIPQLRKYE